MDTKATEKAVNSPQMNLVTKQNMSENPDSTVIQEKHALLNKIVLEKVINFCQLNHDNKSLSALRLVSKEWDLEICRILSKTTEIPVSRLLAPFPDGLGWTWNPQNDENSYFSCPNPDIRSFENIKITGTCEAVQSLQLIRFLACEGHQIKGLHFDATLFCGHQTKFVWDILHCWCPNLETLHLSNVQSFSCLLNAFNWEQDFNWVSHWEFNCDKLHTLILSIEDIEPIEEYTECERDIDYKLTTQLSNWVKSMNAIHTDIKRTSKSFGSIEELASFSKYVRRTTNVSSNSEYSSNTEYKQYLPKHFLDFGIFGHILREAPIQKLVIKKLEKVRYCEDFMIFLVYHPKNRGKFLTHLEFQKHFHLGNNRIFAELFCFLQTPLTTLHLDNILPFENSLAPFFKFLSSFRGSLEHLEFGNYDQPYEEQERTKSWRIPTLPKLKTLIIKSNRCFWFNKHILIRNAPNLQKLSILRNEDEPDDLKTKHLDYFCRTLTKKHLDLTTTYQITELQLAGDLSIRSINNICNKQFCNLIKVDFSVSNARVLKHLLESMSKEWKMLKNVKLSIGSKLNLGCKEEMCQCNYALRDNIGDLKGLNFLDITFQHWKQKFFLLWYLVGKGIRKMTSLTSLKLTNFQMLVKEKDLMESCHSHIPYVSFSEIEYVLESPCAGAFSKENN